MNQSELVGSNLEKNYVPMNNTTSACYTLHMNHDYPMIVTKQYTSSKVVL